MSLELISVGGLYTLLELDKQTKCMKKEIPHKTNPILSLA